MATTASEMLPQVQLDPNPRVRWFRRDGCVEVGPDGTRWVYLAGTLLGGFTPDQPVERDILAAMLSGEKGIASGKLGPAFGVSAETIRAARARSEKGGLAALTDKRKRGAPTKQTPALVRRVRPLFEQGMKPRAVCRAIKGKVSEPTVRKMYRQWQAEVVATQSQVGEPAKAAEVAELTLFERLAQPANEVAALPAEQTPEAGSSLAPVSAETSESDASSTPETSPCQETQISAAYASGSKLNFPLLRNCGAPTWSSRGRSRRCWRPA